MSAFSGRQKRGATRERKAQKRIEAEARNELTDLANRKQIRKQIQKRFEDEPMEIITVEVVDDGRPKRKKGKTNKSR